MQFIYLLSILAGIFYGITESINKNIVENKYSPFTYGFIQYFFNFLLYFIPFLFFFRLPPLGITYFYIFLILLIVFVGNTLILKAYKTEDVSNISILARSSLIINFIFGISLLGESFNSFKLFGVLLVISGIVVIFYEGKKIKLSEGFYLALVAGLIFGTLGYLDKLIFREMTPLTYITISQFCLAAISWLIPQVRKQFYPVLKKYTLKIIISRITAVIGIYLILFSIQKGNLSVVNTNFESVYLLSTVFIGILILKEIKFITKKIIGSALCTLGIILLNIF